MDLRPTHTQRLLLDSARSMFERHAPLERLGETERSAAGYDHALWERVVDSGWTGLVFPDSVGGSNGSVLDLGLLLSCFGRWAVPAPFFQTVVAGLTASRLGDVQVVAELVKAIATGGAKYTLLAPTATTIQAAMTAGWVTLDGAPVLAEWALAAQKFIAAARLADGHMVLVLVDPRDRGVEVEGTACFDNERVAWVELKKVRLPVERVLTSRAVDPATWKEHVALVRVLRAAEMLGGAARALEMTVAHVIMRHQFGRPLGSFQAVQHHCANMHMDVDAAGLLVWYALWRAGSALAFSRHASMAAYFTGQAAERVTLTAHQLHGGVGFMKDYYLHYFSRRAKAQQLRLGSRRQQRSDVAEAVLSAAAADFRAAFLEWPTVSDEPPGS